jgi:hypothetical protein
MSLSVRVAAIFALAIATLAPPVAIAHADTPAPMLIAPDIIENYTEGTVLADGNYYAVNFDSTSSNPTFSIAGLRPDGSKFATGYALDVPTVRAEGFSGAPFTVQGDSARNLYGLVYRQDSSGAITANAYLKYAPDGSAPVVLPFTHIDGYSGSYHSGFGGAGFDAAPNGDVFVATYHDSDANSGLNEPNGVTVVRNGASHDEVLPGLGSCTPSNLAVNASETVYVICGDTDGNLYLKSLANGQTTWTIVKVYTPADTFHPGDSYPYSHLDVDNSGRVYLVGTVRHATSQSDVQQIDPANPAAATVSLLYVNADFDQYFSVSGDGAIYYFGATPSTHGLFRQPPAAQDPPPTAPHVSRSVRGGETTGVVLSGSDPDGDALTYSIATGPGHGTLSGSAPDLTYTPTGTYTGPDSFTYQVDDGKGGTAVGTVTLTVTDPVTGVASVSQPAAAGETVATAAAPTASEPTTSAVTTPVPGNVTITEDPSIADPSGYAVVGAQYQIDAPQASVEAPLALTFQVAASSLPAGQDAATVTVFRNGVAIGACADSSGTATPDPCVSSRVTSGGVIAIKVLSSHASQWTIGVPLVSTTTTVSPIANSTYGQLVSLKATVAQLSSATAAGSVVFKDGATVLGSAALNGGAASLAGQLLAAGTHSITAVYSGSSTSAGSTSPAVSMTVAKAPLVVATASTSSFISLLTFRVTYTTTVKSAVTGLPISREAVTTRVTGGSANTGCTTSTNASGIATCTAGPIQISVLTPFTATVAGSANYLPGTANGKTNLF